MRYLLTILIFILGYVSTNAQTTPSDFPSQMNQGWQKWRWSQSDSGTMIALRDTLGWLPRFTGTFVVRPQDRRPYFYDSTDLRWYKLLTAADQIDTTSLSNRINLKLNISDTANMLLPYLRAIDTTNRWVQNIYSRNDSLFKFKNGTETFVHEFAASGSGTVTSVALSMPSAFTVTGSPITTSGTFSVSGAGTSLQYIRGNGTLATFDTSAIPSFSVKVRSLFSGTSPIQYNNGTISILDATTVQKGAASFNASNFSVSSGAVSLADLVTAGSCINCQLSINAKGQVTSYADGNELAVYNASGAGDTLVIGNGDTIKRVHVGYGLNSITTATNITHEVDTSEIATQYDLTQITSSNDNIGSGFRWAIPNTINIKTVYNSNTILWDSTSNTDGLTAKADTSVLATQYDLTQIAVTANNGVLNNANVIQLGDISSTTTATLTVSRFLRSGNNSIWFQGNKTNNGVANIIFDDTLSATPGNPKGKFYAQYNSLDHVAPAFYTSVASVDDGTGLNNHIKIDGFNLSPMNTRVNSDYGAIGTSVEGAFQGLQEYHIMWIPKDDVQRRLYSITADTLNKTVDQYFSATSVELKDVDAGNEVWAQFTGGNGGTNTSFYLMSGSTNQYNLQYGFGVGGGNTSASIVTTGPGNKSFSLDSWSDVQLPRFTSFTTYNEFEAQVLPNADGTLILGSPTQKWTSVNNYYTRSAFGMRIGDFSADQLPANNFLHIVAPDAAGAGVVIEGPSGGLSSVQIKASTASYIPFITLFDQDDGTAFAGSAMERTSSPIMGGTRNDFLIYNGTNGRSILFGTNSGSGRVTRMSITSSGTVNVANLAGSGTRMVTADASGNLGTSTIGNTLYTGDGTLGSDRTVSTGGFTTIWTGSNDNETSFSVTNTGTTSASAISGTASGTSSIGVSGTSTSYIGVLGTSTSNNAVTGQSTSGVGVVGTSSSGAALRGQINPTSTNTIDNTVTLLRTSSSGGLANDGGSAIQYELETATNGTSQTAGSLAFKWTDATNATRTSQFEIYGINSATTGRKMALAGTGQMTLDGYTTDAFSGTPTNSLQTTSTGTVIQGPLVASGTWTATLTAVSNVTGTPTFVAGHYTRVGNEVTYSIEAIIDPTSSGTVTEVRFSLPIASNLAATGDILGTLAGETTGTSAVSGHVEVDAANDEGKLQFTSQSVNNHTVTITGHYTIFPLGG